MRQPDVESGKAAPPSPDEVRAALDSVLKSQGFRKSERYSHFLRFVCETTLNGDAAKLNEYLIAQEVFGRGADYSPGDDSVVRRQAYSLRQKLQDYYASDGQHDSIRIEIPVGRYVPTFVRALPEEPPQVPQVPPPPEIPPREAAPLLSASRRVPSAGLVVVFVLALTSMGVLCGWLLGRHNSHPVGAGSLDPALAELWGFWLADPEGPTICYSNSLTTIVRQVPAPFPPNTLPHRVKVIEEEAEQVRRELSLPPGGYIYMSPGTGHAKMGEALGSIPLTVMFTKAGIPVQATQSRFLTWADFRNKSLILLGHDEANPWLDPILSNLPLRLAATEAEKPRRIVNTKPQTGEPAAYHVDYDKPKGQPADDYALVSMLSGIDGHHRLMLANGLNAEGTQAALEFLTEPATARSLLTSLRKAAPNHKGEWHFQIVLRSVERDRIPTRVDVIAIRVLPQE